MAKSEHIHLFLRSVSIKKNIPLMPSVKIQAALNQVFSLAGAMGLTLIPATVSIPPADAEGSKDNQHKSNTIKPIDVMSVNLQDAIRPNLAIQGQTQGAGTPNEAGISGFYPIYISANGVFFVDALANVNFSDFTTSNEGSFASSIINTTVKGGTVSTSTRLGYRWLNNDRSWMFGVNAGYDSRPMATGNADTGISVSNSQTVFFQQIAVNAEAASNSWRLNGYALLPVGKIESQLNNVYNGGALQTFGFDLGYNITPALTASVGYYYQDGDAGEVNGSGVLGRIAYDITDDFAAGVNVSYDDAFRARASIDLKYRFNFGNKSASGEKKHPRNMSVIMALSESGRNRDVRVHDCPRTEKNPWGNWDPYNCG